jgi:drug/metabolite transporter (DMT)-like permease
MIHLLALLGVLSISFSAVFVRLAAVSPVTAAFFRAVYALPVLLVLWLVVRARDLRSPRARLVAAVSGLFLATDLAFWHASIAFIGVGLATVVANVQVVFVAIAGWMLYREKPTPRAMLIIVGVLAGVVLSSGLAQRDAYGLAPATGAVLSVLAGAFYCVYLMMFRSANRGLAPAAGPLLDATVGTAIGALACSLFDPKFSVVLTFPAHWWLILLALVSQVVGWLCIAAALPRLPALETSILLLVQPVFAIVWGEVFFREHLSSLQWAGAGLVLFGVAFVGWRPGGLTTHDLPVTVTD